MRKLIVTVIYEKVDCVTVVYEKVDCDCDL